VTTLFNPPVNWYPKCFKCWKEARLKWTYQNDERCARCDGSHLGSNFHGHLIQLLEKREKVTSQTMYLGYLPSRN